MKTYGSGLPRRKQACWPFNRQASFRHRQQSRAELELQSQPSPREARQPADLQGRTPRSQGHPVVYRSVVTDSLDCSQVERALREAKEMYRSLFAHMLNGFALCEMDYVDERAVDFTYLDVNAAFETLTGLKDVAGKKAGEVIPGIHETDPELLEIFGRVARTGMPERFEKYVRSLDMWFAISVYSPKRGQFVAVFDVITERKRAEEALRASEEKFRAYMEQAADAIFVHDYEGRFLDVNRWACESLGYSREELLGMNVQDIEQNFTLESAQRAWSEFQPGMPFTLYGTHRRKDGTTFPVEVRFGGFELEGQKQFLGLARNITRRLQVEETLRARDDLLQWPAKSPAWEAGRSIPRQWRETGRKKSPGSMMSIRTRARTSRGGSVSTRTSRDRRSNGP